MTTVYPHCIHCDKAADEVCYKTVTGECPSVAVSDGWNFIGSGDGVAIANDAIVSHSIEGASGWVCPVCDIGIAPDVAVCPKCSERKPGTGESERGGGKAPISE